MIIENLKKYKMKKNPQQTYFVHTIRKIWLVSCNVPTLLLIYWITDVQIWNYWSTEQILYRLNHQFS